MENYLILFCHLRVNKYSYIIALLLVSSDRLFCYLMYEIYSLQCKAKWEIRLCLNYLYQHIYIFITLRL